MANTAWIAHTMTPPLKYYFVLPRTTRPIGGTNILLWLVETLQNSGFDAAPLYPEAKFKYAFYPYDGQSFHAPALRQVLKHKSKSGLKSFNHFLTTARSDHQNTRWTPSARDVFVLPEFIYPQCMRALPPAPCILAAQNGFSLAHAFMQDQSLDAPQYPKITTGFTVSDATYDAATTLIGPDMHRMRLPVCQPDLAYRANKKLQIAYMPRKRSTESAMVVAALKMQPEFQDIPFVPIAGMSKAACNRILSESLIFLSFSQKEGFGLPPAEAMATGSIVIGYTGIGGNEYFTPETGFVVEDGNIFDFIRAIKNVVTDYRTDPGPLNMLRQHASQTIWDRYSADTARQIACETWARIDQDIRKEMSIETIA